MTEHWNTVKKVLRYVKGTQDLGLWLGHRSLKVHGFYDADFAGDVDTHKSTTAYIFQLGTGAVSWRSVLQPTVAVSTVEAEYMTSAAAAREALWLKRLVVDFGLSDAPIQICSDSQSAIALAHNPVVSQRSLMCCTTLCVKRCIQRKCSWCIVLQRK
jgi:hypothetical protein